MPTNASTTALPSSSSSWFASNTLSAASSKSSSASKYGTTGGRGERRRPRVGLGFFDDKGGEAEVLEDELDLLGLKSNEGWSISVSREAVKPKMRLKRADPALTLYVSTPTASLTLERYWQEVYDLDARLRSQLPGRLPSRKFPVAPPSTPKKRNVLATLSRTLSPRRSPSTIARGPPTKDSSAPGLDLSEIGAYLTELASDSTVRAHPAFKTFFVVRSDDLESARVERRIKRAKSDLTTHLTPSREMSEGTAPPNKVARDVSGSEGSSSGDGFVDTSTAAHLSLFPLPSDSSPHKVDTATSGDRREASEATDLTGSSETGVFELPSRPTTAQPGEGPGSRRSRIIEMPGQADAKPARKRTTSKASVTMTIASFECMRVLGKGCAGKVLLVRQRETGHLFALKAIHKTHVLAHRELDHTRTEQAVLKRCSRDHSNPFVVKLHYSFHDQETLYLALDFHPGGDLATQLARWGRLGRDRARFYCAEITEGVEGLHRAGVIYRDLKPENILISGDGHVVLTDFGLSKDFGHMRIPPSSAELRSESDKAPRPHWLSSDAARTVSSPVSWAASRRETTSTFCGTAEYLAPEVLLGEPYSYEVDAWSLGTTLYEMLSGLTPFWSEDHSTMYRKVLHSDLTFDDDARTFDDDTKSLLRGLLQRDPLLRMTDERIKKHPYFSMIEWPHVFYKRYVPPFLPSINPLDPSDTSQFDDVFLTMEPQINEETAAGAERDPPEGEPQAAFDDDGRDVFDGYSFYGKDGDSIYSGDEGDGDTESNEDAAATTADDGDATLDHTFSSFGTDSTLATTLAADTPPTVRLGSKSQGGLDSLAESPSDVLTELFSPVVVEDHEKEQSDSDWDILDADVGGEARNGGRGTTLWARGVKDRYKLLLNSSSPRNSSPLRPPIARSGSRKVSGSSLSSATPSPSSTPVPPRRSLRRLGSLRTPSSAKLGTRRSQRSLKSDDLTETHSRRLAESASSSGESTPKKAGAFKRLTLSAFRPSPNPKA